MSAFGGKADICARAIWLCFFGVLIVASLLMSNSEQLVAAINSSAMW
jgi:hypothetical protein